MKKIISIAFLVIAITTNLKSQDLVYGLRVGPNFSALSGSDAEGLEGKTGFNASFMYKSYVSDLVNLETGLAYSTWGASGPVDSLDIRLGYMDFPVFIKYNVYYGLTIEAGLEFGLLVSSKYGNDDESYGEYFKFFDTRYMLGLGYQTEFGLTFDLFYKASFSSIGAEIEDYNSNGSSTTSALDLKNSALQLSVGFFFE